MKIFLRYAVLLAACGCLGSAATGVGSTDTYPLVRVDGAALPQTISDATGNSIQVIQGSLTTTSSSISCDYKIDFSNGKSMSGTKTCSLTNDMKVVSDGVEFTFDAGEIGGPQGGHAYDFKTDNGRPCTCGLQCVGGGTGCKTDQSPEGVRNASSEPVSRREEPSGLR